MTSGTIPLLDLKAQYRTIGGQVRRAVRDSLRNQEFILGPAVESFEKAVASYVGTPDAVGVANGTDALILSLKAVGVGPGDAVITTTFSFFATAGSICNAGARPVFVDIDPATYNLDPGALTRLVRQDCAWDAGKRALTHRPSGCRVRAILPVHLFGQPAEMDPIMHLAKEHDLAVIEDAAQAIGARDHGRSCGAIGDAGALSFFPSKNLGGFGDGGMVVTKRSDLAARVRLLRVHGSPKRDHHVMVGTNSRLDALQASILSVKLSHLERWTERRRAHAALYGSLFRRAGLAAGALGLPTERPGCRHVYNQYVVRVPDKRDRLEQHLKENGIGCAVYYRRALHLQDCFKHLGCGAGDFPEAERAASEVLALPVYPELKATQQRRVVSVIQALFRG
ncbi:MAG: DegT/DnrJ/EryC1/StrS family aminotransferase [Elusimicrobia bacterium]|nr:DegT/DnrJ/EryC1/StrS family aminotransferase [Elusimicrobiota bacterium]